MTTLRTLPPTVRALASEYLADVLVTMRCGETRPVACWQESRDLAHWHATLAAQSPTAESARRHAFLAARTLASAIQRRRLDRLGRTWGARRAVNVNRLED